MRHKIALSYWLPEFAADVRKMRHCQKAYAAICKDRRSELPDRHHAMIDLKEAERIVDWWLEQMEENPEQTDLCEQEGE